MLEISEFNRDRGVWARQFDDDRLVVESILYSPKGLRPKLFGENFFLLSRLCFFLARWAHASGPTRSRLHRQCAIAAKVCAACEVARVYSDGENKHGLALGETNYVAEILLFGPPFRMVLTLFGKTSTTILLSRFTRGQWLVRTHQSTLFAICFHSITRKSIRGQKKTRSTYAQILTGASEAVPPQTRHA